jgi:hypothetical protein
MSLGQEWAKPRTLVILSPARPRRYRGRMAKTKLLDPTNKAVRGLEHDIIEAMQKHNASLPDLALATGNVIYMKAQAAAVGCDLVNVK